LLFAVGKIGGEDAEGFVKVGVVEEGDALEASDDETFGCRNEIKGELSYLQSSPSTFDCIGFSTSTEILEVIERD
jgi:hypothetical protein